MKPILALLLAVILCSSVATAQPGPKLKAAARWELTNTQQYLPYDSITYIHTGNRNTLPAINTSGGFAGEGYDRFDTAVWYSYDKNASAWKYYWRLVHAYDGSDSITIRNEQQMNTMTQSWTDVNRHKWVYNASQQPDTTWIEAYDQVNNTYVDDFRSTFAYQGGKLVEKFTKEWLAVPAIWRDARYDSFYYNQNGYDSIWILGMWSQPGHVFNENYRQISQYDANGNKIRDTLYANFTLNKYTEYQYDANGKLQSDSSFAWVTNQSAFQPLKKSAYLYDAGGNLVKKTTWGWDKTAQVYYESARNHYTYNIYDQLIKYNGENFYNNVWKKDGLDRYYYYDSTTSVQDITVPETIELYPVPAVAHITLQLNFGEPQHFTATITDMQGRVLRQWADKAHKGYTKRVYLHNLPAGNYTMQVATCNERMAKTFTVVQ